MEKRSIKAINRAGHQTLANCGAANGIGNRARTIPSKRDKANNPKRQRKSRDWMRGE